MKKNLHFYFVCALFALFFSACETHKTAILTPEIPDKYVDRQGFTTQNVDSVAVTFGFLFSTREHLVFEVGVDNKTDDSLQIDPTEFYYVAQSLTNSTLWSSARRALSMNQVMLKINERADSRRATATALWIVGLALTIAADVAANDNQDFKDYSFSVNVGTDLTLNWADALISNKLSERDARAHLEKTYFYPKTIGRSGHQIGTVYFPRLDTARRLRFNFRIKDRDFETPFLQTIR
ncbi:MAG: hypothetical protein HC817_15560 [Saprospiraceae bacterium]|nr:hypothetical protein [Saprospiraceae bacterium]